MITVSEYPERVLIVLNADGTLKAAHQERVKEIREDGQVISLKHFGAEAVNAQTLAGIIDASALLVQVETLMSQLKNLPALQEELYAVKAERDQLATDKAAIQSQLSAANAQIATLEARIAELQNPWGPRKLAPYDFLSLLTGEEIYAMQTSVDPVVIVGRTKLQTIITYVDLDNPETIGLVRYLESAGLLAAGRADQILSGEKPT